MKEPREMFSAVFEKYDTASCASKSKTHFSDVRSREGGVVKRHLIFDEEISSTIPKLDYQVFYFMNKIRYYNVIVI